MYGVMLITQKVRICQALSRLQLWYTCTNFIIISNISAAILSFLLLKYI